MSSILDSNDRATDWPYDPRSSQVFAEQLRDRERVEQDIQTAWNNVMEDARYDKYPFEHKEASESDIKLLKWALGVK